MEILLNNKGKLLSLIFLCLVSTLTIKGQEGYKGIKPLHSNCKDVKQILNIKECKFPVTKYKTKELSIYIEFTKTKPSKKDKICWNVPSGTVLQIEVLYKKTIPVSSFEFPLVFVDGPIDDVNTMLYENKQKSIQANVFNNYINYVKYLPNIEKKEKLSFPCPKHPNAGDDFETPTVWIDRYWKITEKEEHKKLNHLIYETKIQPLYKKVYIVYYYKNRNEKEIGYKQAESAKSYLESQNMPRDMIKIYNGGKSKKSEIVLYLVEEL